MRRASLGLALVAGGVLAFACASFGEEGEKPPNDGGASSTSSTSSSGGEASVDAGSDTGVDAPPDPPTLPCVPYPASLKGISALEQRTLYVRSEPEPRYPFGIATDRDFVYWSEQRADANGSGLDVPYDGKGIARILRVSRAGAATAPATVLADDQPKVMGVSRDGAFVYWATEDASGNRWLRRVLAACGGGAACTVEDVGMLPVWVIRFVRPQPGLLFGLGINGAIFRIDTSIANIQMLAASSSFPGITATPTNVYFSSQLQSNVRRLALDGGIDPTFGVVDGQDAGDGIDALSADCDSLWGIRPNVNQPYRVPLGGGTISSAAPSNTFGIFDTAADERYLYLAAPDGRGFHALDKKALTGLPFTVPGSYWRIAHDEQGIYLAEHSKNATSAGRITMLVKQ